MQKWSCKNPLTIEERYRIKELMDCNLSSREIGEQLDRAKSTILRESKRLGDRSIYDAELAQKDFETKQHEGWKKCRETKRLAIKR